MPAPASGVIEELLVEDGGRVVAGQEIFKLKLGGEFTANYMKHVLPSKEESLK